MDQDDEEKNHIENNWYISELKDCPNLRINLLSPTNIVLDYVKAYNAELCVHLDKISAKITLNSVPKYICMKF